MNSNRKGTFQDLNALFVFGACTVLIIHILGFFVDNQNDYPWNRDLEAVTLILLRFGRSLFVFATGMLLFYWYQNRQMDWTAFWKKRWRVIVLPYVIWTAIFTAFQHQSIDPLELALPFFNSLFTGSSFYHLYYIPLYLQLNLLFIVTKPLFERYLTFKVLAYLFVGQIVLYLAYRFLFVDPLWTIDWSSNMLLKLIQHSYIYSQNYVYMYVFMFSLGAFAGLHVDSWRAWTTRLQLPAFGVVLLSGTWIAFRFLNGRMSYEESLNIFDPLYLIYTVSFLVGFYPLSRHLGKKPMLGEWLSVIARQNMAIYIVHPLILFLLESYVIFRLDWSVPLIMLMMFLITPPLCIFLYEHTLVSHWTRKRRAKQTRSFRMETHKA